MMTNNCSGAVISIIYNCRWYTWIAFSKHVCSYFLFLCRVTTRGAEQRQVSCDREFPVHVSEYTTEWAGQQQSRWLATSSACKYALKENAAQCGHRCLFAVLKTYAFKRRLFTRLRRHARTGGVISKLTSAELNRLVAVFPAEWT